MAAIRNAQERARRANDHIAQFDAALSAMVTKEADMHKLKGPYIEEAKKSREALIALLDAHNPEFAAERKRKQEEQWADGRRRLRAAFGKG